MRTYEALSAAYFLILAIGGLFAPADTSRRAVGCLCALACVVLVSLVSMTATALRDWAPLAYIAAGYWIPSLFVTGTAASPTDTRSEPAIVTLTRFERWLLRADAWLRPWLPPIPAWTAPLFEVAYLTCYPLVPIGFLLIFIAGTPDDVNRFWSAVLTSGYACYGTLPWLQSRPPRFLPRPFDYAQGKPFDYAQGKPVYSAEGRSAFDEPVRCWHFSWKVEDVGASEGGRVNERQMVSVSAVIGAAIGAAAGYLFFTERGRGVRDRMEPFVNDLRQEFTRFQRTIQKVGDMANEGMRVVQEFNNARGQSQYSSDRTSH